MLEDRASSIAQKLKNALDKKDVIAAMVQIENLNSSLPKSENGDVYYFIALEEAGLYDPENKEVPENLETFLESFFTTIPRPSELSLSFLEGIILANANNGNAQDLIDKALEEHKPKSDPRFTWKKNPSQEAKEKSKGAELRLADELGKLEKDKTRRQGIAEKYDKIDQEELIEAIIEEEKKAEARDVAQKEAEETARKEEALRREVEAKETAARKAEEAAKRTAARKQAAKNNQTGPGQDERAKLQQMVIAIQGGNGQTVESLLKGNLLEGGFPADQQIDLTYSQDYSQTIRTSLIKEALKSEHENSGAILVSLIGALKKQKPAEFAQILAQESLCGPDALLDEYCKNKVENSNHPEKQDVLASMSEADKKYQGPQYEEKTAIPQDDEELKTFEAIIYTQVLDKIAKMGLDQNDQGIRDLIADIVVGSMTGSLDEEVALNDALLENESQLSAKIPNLHDQEVIKQSCIQVFADEDVEDKMSQYKEKIEEAAKETVAKAEAEAQKEAEEAARREVAAKKVEEKERELKAINEKIAGMKAKVEERKKEAEGKIAKMVAKIEELREKSEKTPGNLPRKPEGENEKEEGKENVNPNIQADQTPENPRKALGDRTNQTPSTTPTKPKADSLFKTRRALFENGGKSPVFPTSIHIR